MTEKTTLTQRIVQVIKAYSALPAIIVLLLLIVMSSTQISLAQEDPLPLPVEPAFSTTTDLTTNGIDISANVPSPEQALQTIGDSRSCSKASKPAQLSWFYKPPTNYSMDKLGRKFDIFVLTKNDEDEMRQLHSQGAYPVLQYIHFDSISDPCRDALKPKGTPCTCDEKPLNNQPAWFVGDLCNIRDNHPDWFLKDANGDFLYWGDELIMDPGNAGWRNFFMERVATTLPHGWDGIFIDNLATRFGKHSGNLTPLQKYPTDKSYQDAVVGFLRTINDELLTPNNKLFYSNFSVWWGDNDVYLRYMEHMDGAQDEFWAWKRTEPYTVRSWEERVIRHHEALRRGKSVMMVSQGYQTDYNRQYFTYASYLLLASDKTFFRYSKDTHYGEVWMYDNYKIKLGEPLADYKKKDGDVFVRKFENGKVKVWPGERKAKIKIKDESGMVCR
jgi:hypothetical protein